MNKEKEENCIQTNEGYYCLVGTEDNVKVKEVDAVGSFPGDVVSLVMIAIVGLVLLKMFDSV